MCKNSGTCLSESRIITDDTDFADFGKPHLPEPRIENGMLNAKNFTHRNYAYISQIFSGSEEKMKKITKIPKNSAKK